MCEEVETKTGTGRGSGRQGRQGARCVQWKQWKPKGFQAVEAGDTCVLSERVNRLHASLQVLYIHLCSICSIHLCSICSRQVCTFYLLAGKLQGCLQMHLKTLIVGEIFQFLSIFNALT